MFRQNKRGNALLARLVKILKFHQVRDNSDKIKKIETIKRLRTTDKLFFGKLAESTKEKLKRLKSESKGKIQKQISSDDCSELFWITKVSKLQILKRNLPSNNQINVDVNADLQVLESEGEKTDVNTNSNREIHKIDDDKNKVSALLNTADPSESKKKQKHPLLSKNVVENLLQHSIFDKYKYSDRNPLEYNDDVSKILTISAIENKYCLKYPSVTKILSATMSEESKALLERWKARMIEKLGVRGFEIYHAELLADGKQLHSAIVDSLLQKPLDIPDKIKPSLRSLNKVFENINNVRAIESHVIHPTLMYRGIVDCIAVYGDKLCLIDWKKSDKAKNNINDTYDAPIQLASYIGAVNADINYPFQIKKGIVVVAYTNGNPAKVHEISEKSLEMYWKCWLQRLKDYHVSLNPE